MLLESETLELRGVVRQISKKSGNPYLVFYFEESSGNPVRFVCRDENVMNSDFKKGDYFTGVFDFNRFGNLNLTGLKKVGK